MTPRQERFLIALMDTSTIQEACKKAGISEFTGHKYLKDPEFKKTYHQVRRETLQLATNQLQNKAVKAVEILAQIMENEEATATARIQSARAILDNAYKTFELDDLSIRIEALEQSNEY